MTKKKAIKWFIKKITNDKVKLIHGEDDDWAIHVEVPYVRLEVPSDLLMVTPSDNEFRDFMIGRSPIAKKFSNVTISILHELGHYYNREIYDNTPEAEYKKSLKSNEAHFNLPCELVATDWAIEWLQDKKNRKLARKFEGKFFGGK